MLPANVRLVFLPPYCPELNPIERLWRDLKDDLAWQQFISVEAQQDYVGQLLQAYDALTLQALTGYTYLVDAINALERLSFAHTGTNPYADGHESLLP